MDAVEIRQKIVPVPSLQSLAAIEAAIVVCNTHAMKKCIFAQAKEDDLAWEYFYKWKAWSKMRKKSETLLETLGLPHMLLDVVTPLVCPVSKGMLRYYYSDLVFLDLDVHYVIRFFNAHYFTLRGLIDRKRVAEALVMDETLSVEHRFRIATYYLLEMDMANLWRQMSPEQQCTACSHKIGYWPPSHARLWSSYLSENATHTGGGGSGAINDEFWEESLRIAVKNWSVVAVETLWQKLNPADRKTAAIRCISRACQESKGCGLIFINENPADIIVFLYLQLTKDEDKLDVLREVDNQGHLEIFLTNFLHWNPGFDFLHTVRLCWDNSLWQDKYFILWVKLSVPPLFPGEVERIPCCFYVGLTQIFWCHTPDHLKRRALEYLVERPYRFAQFPADVIRLMLSDVTPRDQLRLVFPTKGRSALLEDAMGKIPSPSADCFLRGFRLPKEEGQERLRQELDLIHLKYCYIGAGLDGVARFADVMKFCLQFEDEVSRQERAVTAVCHRSLDICRMVASSRLNKSSNIWEYLSHRESRTYRQHLYFATSWILYVAFRHQGRLEALAEYWNWFGFGPGDVETLHEKFQDAIMPASGLPKHTLAQI